MAPTIGGHGRPAPAPVWQNAAPGSSRSATLELNQRIVVFAGHGSYASISDAGPNEYFIIPKGVRIVFWCLHGHAFAGSTLDSRMHTNDFRGTQFDWDINHAGGLGLAPGLPEVHEGGKLCRQYRLTPPAGLALGNDPVRDKRFVIVPDRGPQNIGHRLSDLLAQHSDICTNCTVHWAACRSIKAR